MIKVSPKLEKIFLISWALLWVSLAVVVMAWVVQEASAQCYVVAITENVIVPSIPWYYQVVPVVIGQSVSCY
jgi:hypothetical protein